MSHTHTHTHTHLNYKEQIITNRECGKVMFSVVFVCLSVCLSVCVCVRVYACACMRARAWVFVRAYFVLASLPQPKQEQNPCYLQNKPVSRGSRLAAAVASGTWCSFFWVGFLPFLGRGRFGVGVNPRNRRLLQLENFRATNDATQRQTALRDRHLVVGENGEVKK